MRLVEFISETISKHPLPKGVNRWAENQYAAFVVVMKPEHFIYLTTESPAEEKQIYDAVDVSLADFKTGVNSEFHRNKYGLPPFLEVYWPSGKIKSHEGRHRAARVAKAGGKQFTCYVIFRRDRKYTVNWEEINLDNILDDEPIRKSQSFDDKHLAKQFEFDLRSKNRNSDQSKILYRNINIEASFPPLMKGGPESKGWDYAPWLKEHMIERFVGQYSDYRTVLTSGMKFAPMKSRINKKTKS